MERLAHKRHNQALRAARVRKAIRGSGNRPRLSINISHKHISAQLIDDITGQTLAAATTVGNPKLKGNLSEKAAYVGAEITKKALNKKIKAVSFDRGAKRYHGRIKALADAARAGGLEF